MSQSILQKLRETFAAEADGIMARLEELLHAMKPGEPNTEGINALFRAAHTLKGSALAVELQQLGELAHVVEELFLRWRDKKTVPNSAQINWALGAVEMLASELKQGLNGDGAAGLDTASSSVGDSRQSVSVPIERLDDLLDLVGELIIARGQAGTVLSSPTPNVEQLRAGHEASALHYKDLQERIMRLRLVPFGPSLRRLDHMSRDVAAKLGKKVKFESDAFESELDAAIIDGLKDPLMHMVRNSVDHGVETPNVRREAGKEETGTIRIEVKQEGGFLEIRLIDDGAGVNRAALAKKASLGGADVSPEALTDKQMCDLIFQAGFSTAEVVTDVSGRGVGMDVVRDSVEKLRGSISLKTQEGRGTEFLIRVPLALAIMNGFRFGVGERSFVTPADAVVECVQDRGLSQGGERLVELRGVSTPRLGLRRILKIDGAPPNHPSLLLVKHSSGPVAIEVDQLFGEEQTVIKGLGPFFRSVGAVAGSTVLGSGEVAMILDVHRIIDETIANDQALDGVSGV